MGADLLVLTLDWPKRKKESPDKGFLKRCDAIDKYIDKLEKMNFEHEPCDVNPDWELINGKVFNSSVDADEGAEVTLDGYKQCLYDLVDEIRLAWDARDTALQLVGNRYILITGGMSWGDSPGETFDALSKLYAAGVI